MSVSKYFKDNYLPALIQNYTYRENQVQFSEDLFRYLEDYKDIVAEAPTGYGKTIAYLVPIFELGRRTIISTKSKQLMNQILLKDIPIIKKIFKNKEYKVATLLGRRNYFCHYRYSKFIVPYSDIYPEVVEWANGILDNKITEVYMLNFGGDVLNKITADSYQCIGGKCPYIQSCSFYNAKNLANEADIVITNHHMILADIAMRLKFGNSFNFEVAEHIIFDEAHSVADIFPLYLGEELNFRSLLSFARENRKFIGDNLIKKIEQEYMALCIKAQNINRKKLDDDFQEKCVNFVSEMWDKFHNLVPDDEYSVMERYWETMKKIKDTNGVKVVEGNGDFFNLRNVPIYAGKQFVDGVKEAANSMLLVSATITFDNSFDYIKKELGFDDTVITLKLVPENNLFSQGKAYIHDEYLVSLEDKKKFYKDFFSKNKGAAIVIFNNTSHMQEIGKFIKDSFKDKKVYYQTDDLQSLNITQDTIILGCSIIREGIDFGNKGIEYVIIDKLPFENISDVYVEAKLGHYKKEYKDPFKGYYLPRAVIFFKQAVGRLIRNEKDRGYWIILDSRIRTEHYGKYFLDVLKGAGKVGKFW
ncbi:MAG: ATP-dependent DNA helicase [Calditerrivibrio sp.]|nr:ATP-dependent DNA helicase [Calditerrivibrio sp.]